MNWLDPGLERGCVVCLVVDVRQRVPHDEATPFIDRIPTENCRPACHMFPEAGTTWSNWTGPPDQPVWSASVSSACGYRRRLAAVRVPSANGVRQDEPGLEIRRSALQVRQRRGESSGK
jgi:hypothetical protein